MGGGGWGAELGLYRLGSAGIMKYDIICTSVNSIVHTESLNNKSIPVNAIRFLNL